MKRYLGLWAAWLLLLACLCLFGCSVEGNTSPTSQTSTTTTTLATTVPTTVDPMTLSIFDPNYYDGTMMTKCGDGTILGMAHHTAGDERVGNELYNAYVWIAEEDGMMPDFPSPESADESHQRHDCLQGGNGLDLEKRAVLFCEGVPNLGDYLMYGMTECPAVYIPDSVQSIGEHTFPENTTMVIHCHAGSYAEQYAKSHGIACEIVEE